MVILNKMPWPRVFILFTILFSAMCSFSQTVFPLKVGEGGRFLEDDKEQPFLIKEISAWGLIQALGEAEENAFMDSVKKKGFNTLMVSIISYDTRFAGGPPKWQGVAPFTTLGDFSTYDTAYFVHADRVLKMAEEKGLLVLLVPCYLGYKGDANQGWFTQLLSPNNNPAKSRQYGEFLGKRYKDCANIIWVAGGDNKGDGPVYPHMDAVIQGIKSFDQQHLWTGHFESAQGTNWSTGDTLYAKYMDLDGLYDFTESALGLDAPQYKTEVRKYGQGKPIFQLDQSYEQDIPHDSNNTNYQIIRRKNYDGLLSGCAGTSFSPGQTDNQCYTFTNWQPLMNTRGMQEMRYCFNLFDSLQAYKLEPDTGSSVIITGRGTFGNADYVCAAQDKDEQIYIAYLPSAREITLNKLTVLGETGQAWWYNPRTGEKEEIVTHGPKRVLHFTPPGEGDWVLLCKKRYYAQ